MQSHNSLYHHTDTPIYNIICRSLHENENTMKKYSPMLYYSSVNISAGIRQTKTGIATDFL